MANFFEKTGMPSYMRKLDGFQIPYDSILRSAKIYDELWLYLDRETDFDLGELNKLVWGDETPR